MGPKIVSVPPCKGEILPLPSRKIFWYEAMNTLLDSSKDVPNGSYHVSVSIPFCIYFEYFKKMFTKPKKLQEQSIDSSIFN